GDVLPDGPGRREQRRHHRRARGPAPDERPGRGAGRMRLHTISVLVEDKPGLSRMTIVIQVDTKPLEQITKQLNKLVNVIKILEHDAGDAVERELMLVKVKGEGE